MKRRIDVIVTDTAPDRTLRPIATVDELPDKYEVLSIDPEVAWQALDDTILPLFP
jgi:hypothetical protein